MLRAAFLTPNLSMGGAERWIVSLVEHSDPSRLQWTGVALSGWGGCDPELCRELLRHTRVVAGPPRSVIVPNSPPARRDDFLKHPLPAGVQEYDDLPAAIREVLRDADVLVTWGGHRFDRFVNRPELPTVLVSHSSHSKPQPLSKRQGISHLVAVSEAAVAPFVYEGNPPVTVIHNGADQRRLTPVRGRKRCRVAWGYNDSHRIIGYVGRFSHEKNPCAAIHAVNYLGDPWRAVYYGELPSRQQAPDPDLIGEATANPREQVRICRYTSNVAEVYSGLDVLMLASHTEAFSMTMIEAWLTGVPIVATPVGAVPELEQRFGPLVIRVPPNPTPEDLGRACEYAMSPDGQAIAARARQVAVQNWTVETMASRWMDYLELIVGGVTVPGGLFTGVVRPRFNLDL